MNETATHRLTTSEIDQFHSQGYLGPFTAVTPEEMAVIRNKIETEVLTTQGPNPKTPVQSRHLDSRIVYDLAAHPEIVSRMASLYGPHLMLWATYFFIKEPGGLEIPWHQDLNFWPLEPLINISAWVALDQVTTENSCVQIIPGSHKSSVPHIRSHDGTLFQEMADPTYFDESSKVNMELEPGQFFLFNEKTLHHSEPNRSSRRRMGMSIRVTIPIVKMEHDVAPLHPGHAAIMIRGEDYMGFNRIAQPPSTS